MTPEEIFKYLATFDMRDPARPISLDNVALFEKKVVGAFMVTTVKNRNGEGTTEVGRWAYFSCEWGKEEIRHYIRDMVHQLVCHEADEWLYMDGEQVHDPHQDDE